MALGFFRKWQKGIIVAMVTLMLIGFVGLTGVKLLCAPQNRDNTRGTSKYGELMQLGEISRAEQDIRSLAMFLRLDMRSMEFNQLRANGDDASLAYALLVQEAMSAGREVGESEIDAYLAGIGLAVDQAEYRKILGRVERRKSGTTEPALRAALGRWLMVLRSYQAYQTASPPSELRLRKLFRDLNEKLTLRIVKVPADKYASDIAAPTQKQVAQQFKKYRSARPDVYPKADSFGFGYAQPARAAVAYMLINNDVIARVTRPGDRAVRDYFRENSAQFTKEVPVSDQPATLPGTTTKPDVETKVETKTVPMDIDEAWNQVVTRLSGQAAEARTEEFIQLVQTNIESEMALASADAELYKKVYDRLIDSNQASSALGKMIREKDIVALRGKTLNRAIPALARAAGLEAICYPWDAEGEFSVSKEVRIPETLQATGARTLGAVLEEITRLAFTTGKEKLEAVPTATTKPAAPKAPQYPKLKWTACRGFANVLFPIGTSEGMTLIPISTGRTTLLDAKELADNKVLGTARSSRRQGRGQTLVAAAMKSSQLVPGQTMYAFNKTGLRRILWQVIKSRPAAVLEVPTDMVRKNVVEDYKVITSYKTAALRAADGLAQTARIVGLEAAAKEAKIEPIVTEPTARLSAWSQRDMIRQTVLNNAIRQIYSGGLPSGVTPQQYIESAKAYAASAAMGYRPRVYSPSMIKDVDFKSTASAKRFLDRVFELVPEDVDKPIAPGPLGPVINIPMPTDRSHFVVQRIGYTPAVAIDFKETARAELAQEALANSEWDARVGFFSFRAIAQRVKYEDQYRKKESDQAVQE
jgi:hypothetical protein